jgi:phospholipid/cholesterol/gamma-HCH transport system substrate-binding protein
VGEIVARLETNLATTMQSFEATSAEWRRVGQNINHLMDTEEGNFDAVVERAAIALDRLTTTMETANVALTHANELVSDPQIQQSLRETIAALPALMQETRDTIGIARGAVIQVEANLANLSAATEPLAEHSHTIVTRLDSSLYQLEGMLTELNQLAQVINSSDGSLQRFTSDPELYDNLNRSAAAMAVLLQNLEPVMHDMRIFSDRVARHPELLGVSGALYGSSGVKDPLEEGASQGTGLFGQGINGPNWFDSSGEVTPASAWDEQE